MKVPRFVDEIIDWLWPRRLRKQFSKRICARCHLPIKRSEHWSRVMWDDKRPRHSYNCTTPSPISVERFSEVRIVEDPPSFGSQVH